MQGKVLNKLAENCEVSFETTCIESNREEDMLYYVENTSGFTNTSGYSNQTIARINLNGEVSAEYKVTFSQTVVDMVVLDDGSLLVCVNTSPEI
jgi:hypothetical protein